MATKNSVFIATPAYSGKVDVDYVISLSDTRLLLLANGIPTKIAMLEDNGLLALARNTLISLFLNSDCTHMLMVDSDLGWNPNDVLSLLKADKELVSGVYPTRKGKHEFKCVLEDDLKSDNEFLKARYIPAGFILISKSAVLKLINTHTNLSYVNEDVRQYGLFNTEIRDGGFIGEDFVFCDRCREAGIDIYVKPTMKFTHGGVQGSLK